VPPTPSLRGPERAFLLGALFHGALDGERLRALAEGGLEWAALVAQADRLGLGAMVHDAIYELGIAGAVPPEPLARLAAEAARNAVQNALFANVAARTQRTLAAAGIATLALKGTAFAACAPAYQALRHQSDVDLLVEEGRADEAHRLLVEAGYRLGDAVVDFEGNAFDAATAEANLAHHLEQLLAPGGVTIELHFHLPGSRDPHALAPVWAGAVTYPGGIVAPSLDDQLGIVCDHTLGNHHGQVSILPRHVADVQTLLRLGASAERAAERYGPNVGASLALVEETRKAIAAPGLLQTRGAELALAPWWMAGSRLGALLQASGGAFINRFRVARKLGLATVFPSRSFMARRYRIEGRPVLIALSYLWRPIGAVWNVLTGK
jgi:hypothetical protein